MGYGMIDRTVYPEVPPRVEYFLTPFGESLAQPLEALLNWSVTWEKHVVRLFAEKKQSGD